MGFFRCKIFGRIIVKTHSLFRISNKLVTKNVLCGIVTNPVFMRVSTI